MRALAMWLAVASAGLGFSTQAEAPVRNGFRLAPASVPVEEILRGGPPRDGIPALDHPRSLAAADAPWGDEETVLGVVRHGEARAYPVGILNWHELVNDTLGGEPILVSFCPLCGTGIVFDRRVGTQALTFGVSGLLYRSDLLMYDRETESLWSQIAAEAVTGPSLGKRLHLLRSSMTQWGLWRRAHPETTVLSPKTGYARDYRRSPYGDYAHSRRLAFPAPSDPRFHPKMPTIGVRAADGAARAYPAAAVVSAGGVVEEVFQGEPVRVSYDEERQVFDVTAGAGLEVIEGYWFAWSAFHPETSVFEARAASDPAAPPSLQRIAD